MAENDVIVASAVVVPETIEDETSPSLPQKRRQSSGSVEGNKRQRLDNEGESGIKEEDQPSIAGDSSVNRRRASKDVDERKRGKRLFGALLGTLAQNSSSTAQKRRTDIERKQREKLKLQAEEDGEKKAQRLNALRDERRQEQKKYDEQTVLIKRSNTLATAHFLQTKTEPILYYKPWELRPEEKARIDAQIKDAEDALGKEPANSTPDKYPTPQPSQSEIPPPNADSSTNLEAVGKLTNGEHEEPRVEQGSLTNTLPNHAISNANHESHQDTTKDAMDEGGDDMVEGGDDAVIY